MIRLKCHAPSDSEITLVVERGFFIMYFKSGMTCKILISNGTYTVGYVNGKPAEWIANNEPLTEGMNFRLIKNEGSTIIFTRQNFKHTRNDCLEATA